MQVIKSHQLDFTFINFTFSFSITEFCETVNSGGVTICNRREIKIFTFFGLLFKKFFIKMFLTLHLKATDVIYFL